MTVKSVTEKNLIPAAKLEGAIANMGKAAHNLQMDMHRVACSVLVHLGTHRDVRIVYKLIHAMPDMARTNGLRKWLEVHAPVSITQDDAGADIITYVKDRAKGIGNGVKLGEAIKKPFWKFNANEGDAYKPMNIEQAMGQFIKRLEADAKKAGVDHTALLTSLKAINVAPAVADATGATAPRPPQAFPVTGDVLADATDIL